MGFRKSDTVSPFFNQPVGKAKGDKAQSTRMTPPLPPVERDIKTPWSPILWMRNGSRISNEAGYAYTEEPYFYGHGRSSESLGE